MYYEKFPENSDVCVLKYNGIEAAYVNFNHVILRHIIIPDRKNLTFVPLNLKFDFSADNWRDLCPLSRGTLGVYQKDDNMIKGRWELIYHDIYTELRFRYKLEGKMKQHAIFFNGFEIKGETPPKSQIFPFPGDVCKLIYNRNDVGVIKFIKNLLYYVEITDMKNIIFIPINLKPRVFNAKKS